MDCLSIQNQNVWNLPCLALTFSSRSLPSGPLTVTFSLLTSSVTVRISVTGFFFTTSSSFTNGSFVTCIFSLFNGIFISVLDSATSSVTSSATTSVTSSATTFLLSAVSTSVTVLLSMMSYSCVTGISTVFVSKIGSFMTAASAMDSVLDTSNLSASTGMRVSISSGVLYLEYSSADGGDSLVK